MTRPDFCRWFSRKQCEDTLVGVEARDRVAVAATEKMEGREDRVLSYSSSRGKWPMGRCSEGRLNIWDCLQRGK